MASTAAKLAGLRNEQQLKRFEEYMQRCVSTDSLTIESTGTGDVIVRAAWPGGNYEKRWTVSDLSRVCRTRRNIIGDILRARGVVT